MQIAYTSEIYLEVRWIRRVTHAAIFLHHALMLDGIPHSETMRRWSGQGDCKGGAHNVGTVVWYYRTVWVPNDTSWRFSPIWDQIFIRDDVSVRIWGGKSGLATRLCNATGN